MTGSARRPPSLIQRVTRALLRRLGGALFRVRVVGLEYLPVAADGLPVGGWICCAVPHRNWVEPFLLTYCLGDGWRFAFVADGPTVARSWWRRMAVRIVGDVIPISRRPDTHDFARHLAAAATAIEAGSVLAIFPEVGRPSRPPELRSLAAGVAHFALHTQAVVLPVVFGGTHELYLRRRIEVRILPPLEPLPRDAGRQEVAGLMARLEAIAQAVATDAHFAAEVNAPPRKRWRWLTGNFPRAT